MNLSDIKPPKGQKHNKRRIGRGMGSRRGKTAGRGMKGAESITGYSKMRGFEGGQMPLQRRLPKRGFTNIFKKEWIEISLAKIEASFNAGDEVTPEILHSRGLIKKAKHDLVILGNGDVSKALNISAHRFTKTAKDKIEKAGGTAANIVRAAAAEA